MNLGYTASKLPDITFEGEFKCHVVDQLIGQHVLRDPTVHFPLGAKKLDKTCLHANKLQKETLSGKAPWVATADHVTCISNYGLCGFGQFYQWTNIEERETNSHIQCNLEASFHPV